MLSRLSCFRRWVSVAQPCSLTIELLSFLAETEKQVGGRGRTRHLKIFRPLYPGEQQQSAAPSQHRARDHERSSRAYYQPTNQPLAGSDQDNESRRRQEEARCQKHYALRQRVGLRARPTRDMEDATATQQSCARTQTNVAARTATKPSYKNTPPLYYAVLFTPTGTLQTYTFIKLAGQMVPKRIIKEQRVPKRILTSTRQGTMSRNKGCRWEDYHGVSGEYAKEQMMLKRNITYTGLARSKGELKCIESDDERCASG